jgi:cytochrome oxidase Cu insertion factor (SCO1/SenC/PrrC family)
MKQRIKYLLLVTLILLIYSSYSVGKSSAQERDDRARAYFGDDTLIDQDGAEKKFYSELLADKVVLINFMFTQCRDACPLMTQRLRAVRQQLGDRFGQAVYFLSLSVDPLHDTVQLLKSFAQKHKVDEPGWRFLTAEANTMTRLLSKLGQIQENPADHSTLMIAGKPSTGHWIKIRPDSSTEAITAQLESLADER